MIKGGNQECKQVFERGRLLKSNRISWEEYFMNIAELIAKRSTCLRRKVGAVMVKDKRILSTGYNGAPKGVKHCEEVGCLRERLGILSGDRQELCRGVHAEQNAIIQAALYGVSILGATLFCTHLPCFICAKMLVNVGIEKIYYKQEYRDDWAKGLFGDVGIVVVQIGSK